MNVRHFKCDPIAKKIKTETEVKKYGLVFDKRVPHVGTFKLYPYGYAQFTGFDAQDILNIETLYERHSSQETLSVLFPFYYF